MARVKSDNTDKNNVGAAIMAIRQGIMDGRFAPGQRLVEIDLMNELEISRGKIREVFRALESEGVVSIEKNRGASVRKISKQEIEDTFEVLETITLLAVVNVARRSSEPAVRKALEQSLKIVTEFDTELDQHILVQDYMKENVRFWGCLGQLSGNAVLEATRTRLQMPLLRLQTQGLVVRPNQREWISLHREILMALLDGDAAKARKFAVKAQQDVLHAMLSLAESAYL